MIDEKLLEILVCPKDRVPLVLAEPALLTKLNRAVAAGRVKNEAGRTLETALEAGLVRQDHALLYPIVDDIPMLLLEEAISLNQIESKTR